MHRSKLFAAVAALFLITVGGQAALAQSSLFNAPTTDTVGSGRARVEFEYRRQTPDEEAPRTSVYMPRAMVGLGRNFEVGANLSFVRTEGTGRTNAFFSPNVKWKFYDNEESGVAASGGAVLFTPVNHRAGTDTFGMLYTNVSKKVQASYGPRLTAGIYGVVGTSDRQFRGPRAGALLGVEQPVHPRVSLAADWLSGKNGFGYFTPGVALRLPKENTLKLGYSFGNDSFAGAGNNRDNRFLFVRYGVTF
jgi:hypothetical protein